MIQGKTEHERRSITADLKLRLEKATIEELDDYLTALCLHVWPSQASQNS